MVDDYGPARRGAIVSRDRGREVARCYSCGNVEVVGRRELEDPARTVLDLECGHAAPLLEEQRVREAIARWSP